MTTPAQQAAAPAADIDAMLGPMPESEVWQLLGRADVILRGVLEADDRAARRRWEDRVRVWLQDVGRAWAQSQRRSW